jgi:hypothetical protein
LHFQRLEFEFFNIILEGDAANVLNPLKENGEKPYWVISSIIEDIKILLRRFNCWSISLISRDVNSFAHNLAAWAFCNQKFGPISIC